MFGTVVPNTNDLSEERQRRYRACYCGLCAALGERYGAAGRVTLNYDMTFLVLLLGSLYEPEETASQARCAAHPVHKHDAFTTKYTYYAADMNILLAYHNCLDDWEDERKVSGLAEARLLRAKAGRLAAQYPAQAAAIEANLAALHAIERRGEAEPDAAANCFGALMGAIFAAEDDRWQGALGAVGESLGRFIYLTDAYEDLEKDAKRGGYNPLLPLSDQPDFDEHCREILTMLIGDCALAFETLPLVQDVDILRNILYSGVWTAFESARAQREKEGSK